MEPKPKSLNDVIDDAAKNRAGQGAPKFVDGSTVKVPLELIDPNPWQPRVAMDEGELETLMADLESKGQLQNILIRPTKEGRVISVVGHRRVESFRRLLAKTGDVKWASINAHVRLALDDATMAAMAYTENVNRAQLSLLEEAMHLERMMAAKLAESNEALAVLTHQSIQRIRRLRRLTGAPGVIKQALTTGVRVVIGKSAEGTELFELRRIDLMDAIAFMRLHDHFLTSQPPARADERLDGVLRRALAANWTKGRVEDYVDRVLSGQRVEEPRESSPPEAALFQATPKRFTIDLARLKTATPTQLAALRAEVDRVLAGGAPAAKA